MKNFHSLSAAVLLFGSVLFSTASAFNSLYAFGDGVCTTTNNDNGGALYHGKRFSNGRVWIEVLAQRQGLPYDASKNWSYFGQDSASLRNNINHFTAPADATNYLFIVWASDADFVYDVQNYYPNPNLATWNTAISASLTNHYQAILQLYAKGVRTLIMPNAVDLTKVPQYAGIVSTADKSFVRGRIIYFNTNFSATVNLAKAACPGLQIHVPDIFALLDDVEANAAKFGLINAVDGNGVVSDVLDTAALAPWALNGPGTNYIFWDSQNPTAKMHAVIADVVQQLVAPVQFKQLIALPGSNQLDVVNMPVGLNGAVLYATNLAPAVWRTNSSFSSLTVTQSLFVSPTNDPRFYRLKFPYQWSWP